MHMLRDGAQLAEVLGQQQGYLYVCGDAKHMAKDVHQSLLTLLQQHLVRHDVMCRQRVVQDVDAGCSMEEVKIMVREMDAVCELLSFAAELRGQAMFSSLL